jgi:hypothetical protein
MMVKKMMVVVGMVMLVGCSLKSTMKLNPDNDQAASMGVLRAEYDNTGTAGGNVKIVLPTGEKLTGLYHTAESALRTGTGTATLRGEFTTMECNYIINKDNGAGHGSCETSDGSLYRVKF